MGAIQEIGLWTPVPVHGKSDVSPHKLALILPLKEKLDAACMPGHSVKPDTCIHWTILYHAYLRLTGGGELLKLLCGKCCFCRHCRTRPLLNTRSGQISGELGICSSASRSAPRACTAALWLAGNQQQTQSSTCTGLQVQYTSTYLLVATSILIEQACMDPWDLLTMIC